jgi:8-oxo-dGTP pyrophosphatase MutT (NUDIX family)
LNLILLEAWDWEFLWSLEIGIPASFCFCSPDLVPIHWRPGAPEFMAHIHEKIDFTVAIFVVHRGRVLLIHHRRLDKWLPLGGHIELDEDPEQAAHREAKEESGLEVELLGDRPPTTEPGTRALIAPRFLDIHRITETHEHIGMIYWARPKSGQVTLAQDEHHDIRWVNLAELDTLEPRMSNAVKWYCRKAIQEVSLVEALESPQPPGTVLV